LSGECELSIYWDMARLIMKTELFLIPASSTHLVYLWIKR